MRYDHEFGDPRDRRYGGRRGAGPRNHPFYYDPVPRGRHARPDYWWIGEHAMEPGHAMGRYDDQYADFGRMNRPHYSPVGGMYHGTGGRFARRTPRPIREPSRFSDWTRWF